jgi:DNA-binding Lrp family transcriptional regulator
MPTAYVLINCGIYHKSEVITEISELPGVLESAELGGAYDILVKLKLGTNELKETIMGRLEKIHDVNSTVALIAIEDTGRNSLYFCVEKTDTEAVFEIKKEWHER